MWVSYDFSGGSDALRHAAHCFSEDEPHLLTLGNVASKPTALAQERVVLSSRWSALECTTASCLVARVRLV